METVWIVVGWALVSVGLIGCFVPVIPGPLLAYLSLFAALAAGGAHVPSVHELCVNGAVVAAVMAFDYIVPAIGAKKFKCSRAGVVGCIVGTFVGLFFLPIGVVAGPFLGALFGELAAGKEAGNALVGAFGAFLGYVAGLLVKLFCCSYLAWRYYVCTAG